MRLHFNAKRNESTQQTPCGGQIPTLHGYIRFPFRSSIASGHLDNFLDTKSIHINISDYANQNRIPADCPIYKIHASQLAANSPIEDRWNCAFIKKDDCISKLVFTVIDGHSGSACSEALAWICLEFVAASLLDQDDIAAVLMRLNSATDPAETANWITEQPNFFNSKGKNVTKRFLNNRLPPLEVRKFLIERLTHYLLDLRTSPVSEKQFWEEALLRLDGELCSLGLKDISSLNKNNPDCPITITSEFCRIGQSGAVGVFGLLDWTSSINADGSVELQIANVGDCSAVLFSISEAPNVTNAKEADIKKLTRYRRGLHRHGKRKDPNGGRQADIRDLKPQCLVDPHNGSTNSNELHRLMLEHPDNKAEDLIRNGGRLLGELAPTRAFGDVRYKWPADRLHKLVGYLGSQAGVSSASLAGLETLPSPYSSPPYLIAKPEVSKFVLKPNDRYLVLATDGLWDTLTPELAASLLSHLKPGHCPATRLMRAALSIPVPPEGVANIQLKEDSRLASALLSLPPGVARLYRDDITLVVVEFNALLSNPTPSASNATNTAVGTNTTTALATITSATTSTPNSSPS
ncbi:hypothetical protein Aperf_G00000112712 [Anoplocephala perfoliata]